MDQELIEVIIVPAHASHALERGASVAVVRDTLGHSSLAVTNRYVHARPSDSSAFYLAV